MKSERIIPVMFYIPLVSVEAGLVVQVGLRSVRRIPFDSSITGTAGRSCRCHLGIGSLGCLLLAVRRSVFHVGVHSL